MPLVSPVIVIPGIIGTTLQDKYSVNADSVWAPRSTILSTIFKGYDIFKDYDQITLHPDNLRYELREPARVVSGDLFGVVYEEFIDELRHELREEDDEPVPVFPFPYDWRQPLKLTEKELERFIDEVIERTKLLPHYHKDDYGKQPKVNLVGHSMGGLIIAGYIATNGSGKVHKVVSLGTPFRGSPEAVERITTGGSRHRERTATRLTPALYHLLPRYEGAVDVGPGLSDDLFDIKNWQPSIIRTLAKSIGRYGLPSSESHQNRALELLQAMLNEAKEYRKKLDELSFCNCRNFSSKNWLCIVGIGEKTPLTLHIQNTDGEPRFDFEASKLEEQWNQDNTSTETGDGTVPYLGARCHFIPTNQVVCVTQDDFAYRELQDRGLEKIVGLHGVLPEMNLVQRLVISHFKGAKHGKVEGIPAPDLEDRERESNWNPPICDLKPKN